MISFPNLLKSGILMIGATLLLYGNKEANIDHSPPRLQPETETKPTQLYPQEYPTVKLTVAEKAQPEPAPIARETTSGPGPVVQKPPLIDLTKVPSRTRTVSNPFKSDGHPLTSDGQPLE